MNGTEWNLDDSTLLAACLARFRRRHRFLLCGRFAWMAAAVSFPAALIVVVMAHGSPSVAAAGVMLAVAGALAAGLVLTPSIQQTAAHLDARLSFDNLLVTALQCVNDSSPVARLVVRDAATRIHGVRPATAIPLERSSLPLGVAAITLGVSLVVTLIVRDRPGSTFARSGRTPSSTGAASMVRPAGRGALNPTTSSRQEDVPGSASPRDSRSNLTLPPQAGAPPAADHVPVTDTITGAAGRDVAGTGPGRGPRDSSATGVSPTPRRGTDGAGRSAAGGAAPDESSATGHAPAGGVTGGVLARAVGQRQQAPGGTYGEAYRHAWGRAQEAISREAIPLRLRPYVKDYFTAIRPPESK